MQVWLTVGVSGVVGELRSCIASISRQSGGLREDVGRGKVAAPSFAAYAPSSLGTNSQARAAF